ncbi:heparan-alpha-glucosaminide N-acetyltransferase [Desulforamulus ferrireducens]|nr:heparan-alpha-glucosaminide N-acetyltransferase [Desulforamulus ferrireducens]
MKFSNRIWELDSLRGLAILLMVMFHLIFDLNAFYQIPIPYEQGPIYYVGKAAAVLFIFVAGVSCTLSRNNVKRGIKLVLWGMVITLVTSIVVPGSNIIFGILHFLGVSILLYPLFKKLNPMSMLLLGTIIILSGTLLDHISMSNNWLAPLGLVAKSFFSLDYYPLIPWFGLFLYGVAGGQMLYREKKSLFHFRPKRSLLSTLGQHSLFIYLIHQPVILLFLYLFF